MASQSEGLAVLDGRDGTLSSRRHRFWVIVVALVAGMAGGALWLRSVRSEDTEPQFVRKRIDVQVVKLSESKSINRVAITGLQPAIIERVVRDAQEAKLSVALSKPALEVDSQSVAEKLVRERQLDGVMWAKEQGKKLTVFLTTVTSTRELFSAQPALAAPMTMVELARSFSRENVPVSRVVVDDIVKPLVDRLSQGPGDEVPLDDPQLSLMIADWYSIMGYQEGEQYYLDIAVARLSAALEQNAKDGSGPLQRALIHIQLGEVLRRKEEWVPREETAASAERQFSEASDLLKSDLLKSPELVAKANAASADVAMSRALLFWTVGGRAIDSSRLNDAIQAYGDALVYYQQAPLQVARVAANMGIVEYELGLREIGDEHLNRAAVHYTNAYSTFRSLKPRHLVKEGNTLQAIGLVNGELARRRLLDGDTASATDYLSKAVDAYVEASKLRSGLQYAKTLMNYSITVIELARWNNDVDQVEQAISFLREARTYYGEQEHPEQLGKVDHYLGVALTLKAVVTQQGSPVREAMVKFEGALARRDKHRAPYLWVETRVEQAYALFTLAVIEDDGRALCDARDLLNEAVAAIEAALVTPQERQLSSLLRDAQRQRRAVVKQLDAMKQTAAFCRH